MAFSQTEIDEVVRLACEARLKAYAPYSKYKVGAALRTKAGKIYPGVNVENAAYPSTICAERTAIFSAVANGDREFDLIAVVTENGGYPCGGCRQVMAEFALDMTVVIADEHGKVHNIHPVSDLLLGAFTPDFLTNKGS